MSDPNGFLGDEDVESLKTVITAPSTAFSLLVKDAGLNPKTDFRYLNLSGVDFSGSDIRGFDFTGSNLTKTVWTSAIYDSSTITAGARLNEVEGLDFSKIKPKNLFVKKRYSRDKNYKERTLGGKVTLCGIGVHTNIASTLNMFPAAANTGIKFFRSDGDSDREVRVGLMALKATEFASVLGDPSGPFVSTVEHVLAALSALGVDNAMIEIDGPEVPIMDGSAAAFVEAIDQVGLVAQRAHRRMIKVLKPVVVKNPNNYGEIRPYQSGLRVEVEIEFDHPLIGQQSLALDVNPGTFRRELARARSFGFMRDIAKLWAAGYALGASFENTLVVAETRVLNPDGLRFTDEFVRHKALDVVGDLALLGAPLLGAVRSVRGGHKLNHAIISALMSDTSAWTIVEADAANSSSRDYSDSEKNTSHVSAPVSHRP